VTGFEEKVKEFLMEAGILKDLWKKSVKRAKEYEEEEENLFETSRGFFEDEIAFYIYEWARSIEDKTIAGIVEEALNEVDFYDVTNDLIIELNLRGLL
jgi:RNA polymerase-interacting CarD/CdnL/TRCF family regulator